MARARNIKPGFFRNADLAELSFECRLLFAGLWVLADREGRLEDRPKQIKMEVFPADNLDVDQLLEQLAECGLIVRYSVNGKRYVWVRNFLKHQMPHHKEAPSTIPPPPGESQVTRHAYAVSAELREFIFTRDGHCCLRCGSRENLSIDHITPLACGGDNSEENLQTLCKRCNSSKGSQTRSYVAPTLNQRKFNKEDTLEPVAPLIPDSGFLIPDSDSLRSSCAPQSEAPEPKAKQKRASTIPADFEPNETCISLAAELGVPLSQELPKFRDHHSAKGTTMKDWQAAFRTCLRNAKQFTRPSARDSPAESRRQQQDDWLNQLIPGRQQKRHDDERTIESTPRLVG